MGTVKTVAAIAGLGALAGYGGALYFFRRTIVRGHMPVEKTTEMSGVDWSAYHSKFQEIGQWLAAREREETYLRSSDGLLLHATWFSSPGARRTAVVLHGYTSKGLDNGAMTAYFLKRGYNVLVPDARAHGDSEGRYIGFGVLDRRDLLRWIQYVDKRMGADHEVVLHGVSMGGATVLMLSGQTLPRCVKGAIADCAFTSAWEVFTHVLNDWYHIPAFPVLPMANRLVRKYAGYDLREANSALEVRRAKIPLLLIHGEKDAFVPSRMCGEIHRNAPAGTEMLIVKGAAHGESYYKSPLEYEAKLGEFLEKTMKKNGEAIE